MSYIRYLSLNNIREYCGLKPTSFDNDVIPTDSILNEVVVLNSDCLVVALNTNQQLPSYKDEDEVGLVEDGHTLIY